MPKSTIVLPLKTPILTYPHIHCDDTDMAAAEAREARDRRRLIEWNRADAQKILDF